MKKALFVAVLLPLCIRISAQDTDSLRFSALDARLDEYFAALAGEPAAVQNEECDFLIESCRDSVIMQHVALRIYGHYLDSKIMGDDAVAVHVADTWFLSGRIKMKSGIDLMNARVFAEFNRSSLIGMKAPEISLEELGAGTVTLFGDALPRRTVLYFYDTECPSCKMETIMLEALMDGGKYDADLYAVCTGTDEDAWKEYAGTHFKGGNARHFIDPDAESDFQRKYGVIRTPGLFLIDRDGTILGRGLDSEALEMLLRVIDERENYDYGGEASAGMFRTLFAALGDSPGPDDIMETADYIASRTLGSGDRESFRRMGGDLLYFLAGMGGEAYRQATGAYIDKYILADNGVWTSENDSLKVIGFASMLKSLLDRAPYGAPVPDVELYGTLKKGRRSRNGMFSTGRLKGHPSLIVFYTKGCGNCREMLAAADRLQADRSRRRMKMLLVDMDVLSEKYPAAAEAALEAFDLSTLPFAIETAPDGTVTRKYIDIADY